MQPSLTGPKRPPLVQGQHFGFWRALLIDPPQQTLRRAAYLSRAAKNFEAKFFGGPSFADAVAAETLAAQTGLRSPPHAGLEFGVFCRSHCCLESFVCVFGEISRQLREAALLGKSADEYLSDARKTQRVQFFDLFFSFCENCMQQRIKMT